LLSYLLDLPIVTVIDSSLYNDEDLDNDLIYEHNRKL